jgi:hypothetical protein
MSLGQGQVVHVGIEVDVAVGTIVLGTTDLQIHRAIGSQIAQIV